MRSLLIEMNQQMVRKNPKYIVRITSDDRVGKKLLDDFIDPIFVTILSLPLQASCFLPVLTAKRVALS